jgi:hypothetical protein
MGQLDEAKFEATIAGCSKCTFKAFEVSAYLDRIVTVMVAQSTNDGRWTHDTGKFFDGIYKIECFGCRTMAYESHDCPRCHRKGGLADALAAMTRLPVPQRCPQCHGGELALSTFAPGTVKAVEHQRAAPTPLALFGDEGYHVSHIACVTCEWTKTAEGCPLCGGAGPLRARP